jgi:hypothetical protein
MTPLVQTCVVLVTLTFAGLVAATMVALIRLGRAAARLTSSAQVSMAQVEQTAREAQELVASLRELTPPARHVVMRFRELGERAADLSAAVLDEIEEPVLSAVALARGVRTGTVHLLDLMTRRFVQRQSSNYGDQDHE